MDLGTKTFINLGEGLYIAPSAPPGSNSPGNLCKRDIYDLLSEKWLVHKMSNA